MRYEFLGLDLFRGRLYACVYLLRDAHAFFARAPYEGRRLAINATPRAFGSVAVRTGKAGVYRNLPHLLSETFFKIIGKVVIEFIAHLYIFLRQEALSRTSIR